MLLDFGQRSISEEVDSNKNILGLFFGDYLNYWIVDDLLTNIELLWSDRGAKLADFIGAEISETKLNNFAQKLKKDSCWFGVLDNVDTFHALRKVISNRILQYESFLNYNSDFPKSLNFTKTKPGDPIGSIADALKSSGIIPIDLPIFITIDQFEDLMDLERDNGELGTPIFRSVIMRMLGNRDKKSII
ncbi:hypothetical protein [Loktanella sp. M215]|uniref:hypothetical protein n=1 Tax=Loktanella sp. M215 TaxID=2675431 RepID=UPI001F2624AD|nr:hypothetical protein [Loktanella sp. M215]MCF7701507.1 hypothetical protein [Loktanella sp. M215]